ncbi:hypothetical protein J7E88_34670 [Streptomyces sp. ISL-10]|uniref:hypothetical protein n=1 Tax=Streptomyces sp. ISL-10 TaxID=2819172 RepID=UPI001BE78C60|nr:hypothetical protein [Streptomyces sp. ISL-10]MBT2370281.1 hypothetical protein [Streptomyces sp. ISL-10]
MPRWVKWPAIIIGIVVLLFVVLKLTGHGGEHGPGRHLSAGAALSGVTQEYARFADGVGSHDPSRWSLR